MASQAVADSFVSRDDVRKRNQLQEARAAGTAAPETDAATGKMINPHNPQFITQAPWYLNQNKPSLQHQQAWNLKAPGTKDWYKRGTKGDVKTKFIKGACENCGATTHSRKDCTERPRLVGAKHNGKNLMPDEFLDTLDLDWDGKRDRWNGFQPDDYKEVIEEWDKVEDQRRKVKAAEMEERAKLKERWKAQKRALKKKRKQRRRQLRRQAEGKDTADGTDTDGTEGDSDAGDSDTDTDTDSDSDASDDEDLGEKMKDFDKTTNVVATKDDKLRTTTRNLRIREDTAKYLLNLNVNSAFYDPKSRSMRQNPLAHLKEEEQAAYRGDNYVRNAGDAKQLTELMVFAWDAYKHGEKVHDMAQPTQALKMWEVYKQRSKDLKKNQQEELLEKYGGEEHLNAPREVLYSQNDTYVEYSRDGRLLKGRERELVKSKYEEDLLVGNHSSIWGSYYDSSTGSWGFKCCRQCLKHAYCVAQKKRQDPTDVVAESGDAPPPVAANPVEDAIEDAGKVSSSSDAESSSGGSDGSGADGGDEDGPAAAARKKALAEKRKARALKGLKMFGSTAAEGAATAATSTGAACASTTATSNPLGAAASSDAAGGSRLSDKRSSAFGHCLEEVTELDVHKLEKAITREKQRAKAPNDNVTIDDERKRKYSTMAEINRDGELSPEEYEAYRLTRSRGEDPMAQFM